MTSHNFGMMPLYCVTMPDNQRRFYVGAWGTSPSPDSLVASPQIQKLADYSELISEVPKCSKIQIFQGSAPDPAGER